MHAQPVYSPQDYALSFQRGEEKGFTWFFRQYYPALTYFAHKITADLPAAEEIASTAFLKTWHRHAQFQSPKGIRAYLYRVVRNDSLKWLRKQQRQNLVEKELAYLEKSDIQKEHFYCLVALETSRQLLQTLATLPSQCQKIFRLIYIEGKTVKETADQLNLSPSTVKTQKQRGLKTLRARFHTLVLLTGLLF